MKIKKIFSIIIITMLCLGKINSQTSTPTDLSLPFPFSRIVDKEYEALNSIQSTQVINNGVTTTYTAGNAIVLKPGFHAKAGSEFTAKIEDISNRIIIITTNVNRRRYVRQSQMILEANADVVAIQEIGGRRKFNTLRNETGFEGEMCATVDIDFYKYGIALLWKPELGTPEITKKLRLSSSQDKDFARAYIIAVFDDFCMVATHYSLAENDRKSMTQAILNEPVIIECQNSNKPVYIAGDLNEQPFSTTGGLQIFRDAGFQILNNMERTDEYQTKDPNKNEKQYEHATRESGGMPDLILEYNTNPNRAVIDNNIPFCVDREEWLNTVSDHCPYRVRVKLK